MKKEGKKVLLLDTGNLLFRKHPLTETKRKDALLRADLLIQSYNDMGYGAINVGGKDLMMGLPFLVDIAKKARFPFLSANLADRKSGEVIFKPYVIKEIDGLRIGIFGLLDDLDSQSFEEKETRFVILEPTATAKKITKDLRRECDLIVILSQLGESKDRKLAKENSEIDLILGGGGEAKRAVTQRVNEIPVYRLEPRGGYLGRIDYILSDMKRPIKFQVSKEWDEMDKKLDRVISRMINLKAEMPRTGKPEETKTKELRFLESRQKELEEKLAVLQEKNFYRHTPIPVQLSVEDDPNIMKRVVTYRAESAKLYEPKEMSVPERELSENEVIARIPKESPYAGAISCKRCHEANYRNWLKSKHAKASETIVASPKYSQEECLVCHSTGHGRVGEYATVEKIPFYLRGVQCEACHGEGKGHPQKRGTFNKVTLGICRNCHTKDQSPTFNYVNYLEKVGCKTSK
jgi:hypothetical protein